MCEVNNEVVEEMSKFNENFSKLLLELNIKKILFAYIRKTDGSNH